MLLVLSVLYLSPIVMTLFILLILRVIGSIRVSGKEHVFIFASVAPLLNWVVMTITLSYVVEELMEL